MKLTVVGSSPAWPNPGGAQSGYLLEGNGKLLLDCGPGVLARLRERSPWPEVDAIAITHFHLDHWGDLVPWTFGNLLGPGHGYQTPRLWLPPGGRQVLAELGVRLGTPDMFERAFDCVEFAEEEPFAAGGFEVTAIRLQHYELASYGFRVAYDGVTIAYSGDSGPSERLPELARDADVFLCEATLESPRPEGDHRGHLTADEAVAAFEASGAKRLLLTHRPSERPLEDSLEQVYDGFELEL